MPLFSGRQLWVVKIALEKNRPNLKPMVKYVANMHGNEVVGRELMLGFIEYLANSYKAGSDPEVTKLLSSMDIHIMPSMNPDGFEISSEGACNGPGRGNGNGFDLNRNFPTWDDLDLTNAQLFQNR